MKSGKAGGDRIMKSWNGGRKGLCCLALLALVLVLGLMPAQAAHADGKVYSITGHYLSMDYEDGDATFTVGETCPVCYLGILVGSFHEAIGSAQAEHSIICSNCNAVMSELCTGDATCT